MDNLGAGLAIGIALGVGLGVAVGAIFEVQPDRKRATAKVRKKE